MSKININEVGFKADLSKYFDSVPLKYIDEIFDRMEQKVGKSKIIDVVRKYYHTDLCFDVDGNIVAQMYKIAKLNNLYDKEDVFEEGQGGEIDG